MTGPRSAARGAVLLASMLLAGCSGAATTVGPPSAPIPSTTPIPDPTPAGSPSADPSPSIVPSPSTAVASWDLVVLGDSVWNGFGSAVQGPIQDRLGVNVVIHSWINPDLAKYGAGGERSADLLARLRTDAALRSDISSAEAIVFDVPMGILMDLCGPPPGTLDAVQACLDKAVPAYSADVDPIFAEVLALRGPSEAVIRVTDVWQFFGAAFRAGGTYDVVRSAWQKMNGAVAEAAARNGIGLLHAYDTFSGPDGERDAIAAGDLLGDDNHLTGQGVDRLVELFLAQGLEPTSD
jgi:hypothetical protein